MVTYILARYQVSSLLKRLCSDLQMDRCATDSGIQRILSTKFPTVPRKSNGHDWTGLDCSIEETLADTPGLGWHQRNQGVWDALIVMGGAVPPGYRNIVAIPDCSRPSTPAPTREPRKVVGVSTPS